MLKEQLQNTQFREFVDVHFHTMKISDVRRNKNITEDSKLASPNSSLTPSNESPVTPSS